MARMLGRHLLDARVAVQCAAQFIEPQHQLLGRQHRALDVVAALLAKGYDVRCGTRTPASRNW